MQFGRHHVTAVLAGLLLLLAFASCKEENPAPVATPEFYQDSRPWVRWWWFAHEIDQKEISRQLDWLRESNFGGVEISWVFPRARYNKNLVLDSNIADWLSPEWTQNVTFAKTYCDKIGLGCDFSLGSAWPAAAPYLSREDQAQIYNDTNWRQNLTFSWSSPDVWPVLNHLDSNSFNNYALPIGRALSPALEGSKSSFFTDSWEIRVNDEYHPWSADFAETFEAEYGYDISEYMDDLPSNKYQRYDYMQHLGRKVIDGFYIPYTRFCRQMGTLSRVQCLASPTDVMTTYSLVDVPETEALLNEPTYSRIVSSAAALSGKPIVSCEAFTCMYGFPGTYLREEEPADLKLLADALFAQGVNHLVYHGMPYQDGNDSANFFATVHVGPDGNLAPHLFGLNQYFEKVSGQLKLGTPFAQVAQYIPYEDALMKGALPPEKRRVWVWDEYEMRYVETAKALEGYHPLWINKDLLLRGELIDGNLVVGDAKFEAIYVDVNFIEMASLRKLLDLAEEGFPIVLRKMVAEPGTRKHNYFGKTVTTLWGHNSASTKLEDVYTKAPLLEVVGDEELPNYWARWHGDDLLIFFANPNASKVKYPMSLGQSHSTETKTIKVKVNQRGTVTEMELVFEPYQSLMYKFDKRGNATPVDIKYTPPTPKVKSAEPQRFYF